MITSLETTIGYDAIMSEQTDDMGGGGGGTVQQQAKLKKQNKQSKQWRKKELVGCITNQKCRRLDGP